MPSDRDTRPGARPARRMHLDGPAMMTTVVAALAAVACIVIAAIHGYEFVRLMLDPGHITARNAELFAVFGWLAAALALSLGCGLLLRLMYRINGSAGAPPDAVSGRSAGRARRTDGSGRRR